MESHMLDLKYSQYLVFKTNTYCNMTLVPSMNDRRFWVFMSWCTIWTWCYEHTTYFSTNTIQCINFSHQMPFSNSSKWRVTRHFTCNQKGRFNTLYSNDIQHLSTVEQHSPLHRLPISTEMLFNHSSNYCLRSHSSTTMGTDSPSNYGFTVPKSTWFS